MMSGSGKKIFLFMCFLGMASLFLSSYLKFFNDSHFNVTIKIPKSDIEDRIIVNYQSFFNDSHFNVTTKIPKSDRNCSDGIRYSESKWFQQRYDISVMPFWMKDNLEISEGANRWWFKLQVLARPTDTASLLKKLYHLGAPSSIQELVTTADGQCTNCAVVGNSANLKNSKYGEDIDQHNMVIRFNKAPVEGFQKDVGSKTTFRILYPESAVNLPSDTSLVLAAFKPLDVEWLLSALTTGHITKTYASVMNKIQCNISKIAILHPDFMRYTHQTWLDGAGRYPSTGILGLSMAFQLCDKIDVYGFGGGSSGRWQHYWENMKPLESSVSHSGNAEGDFLKRLHDEGLVTVHRGSLYK